MFMLARGDCKTSTTSSVLSKKMHVSCFVCICTTCFCPTIPNSALSPKQRWWTSSLQSIVPSHVCDIFFPVMLMKETRHYLMCMTRPENRPKPKRKVVFQPSSSIFRCKLLVLGRVLAFSGIFHPWFLKAEMLLLRCCYHVLVAEDHAFWAATNSPTLMTMIGQTPGVAWHLPTESYYSKL